MTNDSDILDPAALISQLPTLLPSSKKRLGPPQDAIAALLHTIFVAVGFRLISTNGITVRPEGPNNILPEGWNEHGPSHYTFTYKHDQSSLEFELKVSKLGQRTVINAIAIQSNTVESFDVATDDFVSPSFFPCNLEHGGPPLVHGFISSNRIADLTSQAKLKILRKLIPGLRKDGYTEGRNDTSTTTAGSHTSPSPRPEPPGPSSMPGFFPSSHISPRNPLEIGRSDLDPFPVNPLNFNPPPLFPGSPDGMFVGPDHPIFGVRRGRNPFENNRGPWGGDGYLPPMAIPPGARFDPVGPGPLPDRGGIGGVGRGGPARPRRDLGEPDNDEFMPPGMGSMFM